MNTCCNPQYNHTFGMKRAQKEMEQYHKKGPKKTTKWLLEHISERVEGDDSVLDIGGGVGALILALQKQGIGMSYYVDISENYSAVFRHEVSNNALDEKITIHTGDFTEKHHLIPETDIVALDKVLCCYKDFNQLLSLSLQKSRRIIAYTIPNDVWWVRFLHQIEVTFKRLFPNHLITYIHPIDKIESMVIDHGFRKDFHRTHNGWLTVVYSRY